MKAAVPPDDYLPKFTAVLLAGVIGISAVGFLVGINAGAPQSSREEVALEHFAERGSQQTRITNSAAIIPAATYFEMSRLKTGPNNDWKPSLQQIPQPSWDPRAEFIPSAAAKLQSTETRAKRRAYNGAPPIVPHAVERTSDAACYACHGSGMWIGERVANRMSHSFLANCLQCHSPPSPSPFADEVQEVANDFVGLPAPLQGERAYPGAPPTIPHSTWMRNECLSCHGRQAGWAGLEVTHPWRSNCQQCHAPSATLEQSSAAAFSGFVPPVEVRRP